MHACRPACLDQTGVVCGGLYAAYVENHIIQPQHFIKLDALFPLERPHGLHGPVPLAREVRDAPQVVHLVRGVPDPARLARRLGGGPRPHLVELLPHRHAQADRVRHPAPRQLPLELRELLLGVVLRARLEGREVDFVFLVLVVAVVEEEQVVDQREDGGGPCGEDGARVSVDRDDEDAPRVGGRRGGSVMARRRGGGATTWREDDSCCARSVVEEEQGV